MSHNWLHRALGLLDQSLNPTITELNELDWKEKLSSNKNKLKEHLIAMANLPGGGFLVFGIRNEDAEIVGVTEEETMKIIDQLGSIGRDAIEPPLRIDHRITTYNDKILLFAYVMESSVKPAHLRGKTIENSFIRSGGTTRQASRSEIGSLLLHSKTPQFEELRCSNLLTANEVFEKLDYQKIAELLGIRLSNNTFEILEWMSREKIIDAVDEDGYYVTNFGALAAAKDLNHFDSLSRKAIRVVKYSGKNKTKTEKEWTGTKGYAVRFKELIEFILDRLPSSEIIEKALRTTTSIYPEIAIRELVANALIHQDFTIRGTSPMIEIFEDRIEPRKAFTNKETR